MNKANQISAEYYSHLIFKHFKNLHCYNFDKFFQEAAKNYAKLFNEKEYKGVYLSLKNKFKK